MGREPLKFGGLHHKGLPKQSALRLGWHPQILRKPKPASEFADQVQTEPVDRPKVRLLERPQVDQSIGFRHCLKQPLSRTALKRERRTVSISSNNQPPQSTVILNRELADTFDYRRRLPRSRASDDTKIPI
jgi:hypothetical protein